MFAVKQRDELFNKQCERWGCWQVGTWQDPISSIVWCKEHRHNNCIPL